MDRHYKTQGTPEEDGSIPHAFVYDHSEEWTELGYAAYVVDPEFEMDAAAVLAALSATVPGTMTAVTLTEYFAYADAAFTAAGVFADLSGVWALGSDFVPRLETALAEARYAAALALIRTQPVVPRFIIENGAPAINPAYTPLETALDACLTTVCQKDAQVPYDPAWTEADVDAARVH